MINFDRMRKGISYKGWKMKMIMAANGDYHLAAVNCEDVDNKEVVWIGIDEQDSRKSWIENRDQILDGIVSESESGD